MEMLVFGLVVLIILLGVLVVYLVFRRSYLDNVLADTNIEILELRSRHRFLLLGLDSREAEIQKLEGIVSNYNKIVWELGNSLEETLKEKEALREELNKSEAKARYYRARIEDLGY